MRHSWRKNQETGLATCRQCGMTVKIWEAKKGGLPKCPGIPLYKDLKQMRLDCRYHHHALLAGKNICWACGRPYTDDEKEAIKPIRRKYVEQVRSQLRAVEGERSEETASLEH